MPKWHKATERQKEYASALRDRAARLGLAEVVIAGQTRPTTVSQIVQDIGPYAAAIEAAEAGQEDVA